MIRPLRRPGAVAALGLLGLIAACGSNAGPDNGIKNDSVPNIAKAVQAALQGTKSVEVSGNGSYSGQNVTFDVKAVVNPLNIDATVGYNGGNAELWLVNNEIYVKADAKLISALASLSGSVTPSQAQLLSDKCLDLGSTQDSSSPVGSAFASVNPGSLSSSLNGPIDTSGFTKSSVKTVNGTEVQSLNVSQNGVTGELDIATHGKPYPVAVNISGMGLTATANFKNWDSVAPTSAPTGCVSLQGLSGNGGTPTDNGMPTDNSFSNNGTDMNIFSNVSNGLNY